MSETVQAARAVLDCPYDVPLTPALQRLEAALAPLTEEEDAWQMLTELYRVLVLAGAGSSEKRHRYSFSRRPGR